ncbi:MAG: hypothetical protein GYA21_18665 [Myxococcales bacterium]|nr:hypothetical protein [Myxococcales bacterium]
MKRCVWKITWVLVVSTAVMACGGENSVRINLPDGNEVKPDQSIEVQAIVLDDGMAPPAGYSVTFTTEVGSFEAYSTSSTTPVQQKEVEILAGKATVRLYSFPGAGGTGKITAAYTTQGGYNISAEVTITVSGGYPPSGRTLGASCDTPNVLVWADTGERANMKIRCVAQVKDSTGRPIAKANVRFMVEGGCSLIPDTAASTANGEYVFYLKPDRDPMDVEPLSGEPNHMEQGKIHNPRDGLLTIVFYTDGEEGYIDSNSNGSYDPGEPFAGFDLPEPFVDANDNGEFDNGESYVDIDQNGQYSLANAKWDGNTLIWVGTRILFSGPPHESSETTRFEPSGINLDDGASQKFSLFLVDINHNPIANNYKDDGISIAVTGCDATPQWLALQKTMGVEFLENGSVVVESFNRNRSYEITVSDFYPGSGPHNATLDTSIKATAAPAVSGYNARTFTFNLSQVSGTVK